MAVNELIVEASFTSNILNEEERLPGVPTDDQVERAAKNSVDAWLEDNIDPESGYALDRTLTLSNAAAPADLVGAIGSAITNSQIDALFS